MEEYYSIKDVANICNKNKSSVSRKLTNLCFEIMDDDFDMHFKNKKVITI
jgi:predicted transcriptional regulator